MLQTRDGYIWLGTDGGLVRFDGIDFVTFDAENTSAFRSDTINDLLEDSSGALWISSAAGLLRYQNGSFAAFTSTQGLPSDTVWFSYQDHQQRLWAMTAGGPACFTGKVFAPVAGMQSAFPLNRQALAEDAHGMLWLGTSSGLFSLDIRTAAPRLTGHLLSGLAVEAVALDHANTLWVGTNEGLMRSNNGALTPVSLAPLPARTEVTALSADATGIFAGTAAGVVHIALDGAVRPLQAGALAVKHVDRFYRDAQQALWMGSDEGAFRLQGNVLQAFAPGSDLSTNRVLAIYEDREGNLWWGTDAAGLHLLRDQKFTTYTTRDGLSGNFVRSVFQGADGTLWIGTDGAGLNRRTATGFAHLSTADGLSSNVILSLAGGAGSDLWVGTPDGLNLLHRESSLSGSQQKIQVKRYTSADGLPDDFIRSLYTDQDNSLWIGTGHGLAHLVEGRFQTFSAADGLGSDFIGAIFRSQPQPDQGQGDLWIGTSGGLSRLRAGAFTNFTLPQDPAKNTVTAIAQQDGTGLWLGTNGGGLHRFDNSIKLAFPALTRTLPSTVYSILEQPQGQLWLSAPTGIFRLALSGQSPEVTAYGTADGMNIRECSGGGHPTAWKLSDGSLWFATLDGVSAIDPAHAALNQVPPPVVIERVLVDDHPHAVDQGLIMPPGTNRLEFQYAGLSFAAPQKVEYQYMLEGFDRGWINAGTRRSAFYTNLPPGHYRFRVKAANNDGIWNQTGASFALRQRPHYYQTWWFYAALLLAAGLLGYLGYRWRVRQVEDQFGAVLAERGRLAREIHDTLAQGFVGISVQLELVARLLTGSPQTPKPALQQLEQTRALVRESLAEARTSIWDLRSANVAVEDLPARLTRSCNRLVSGSSARVYLQVKGTYRPVPRKIEDQLSRIGQEAVANAARHAAATRIDVQLIYEAANMLLVVSDDGRGFTPLPGGAGPDGHYGIRGMHERAQQIGARLHLESTPGAGTRISVEAPLT